MVIAKLLNRGEHTFRVMDIENSETLRFVVILKPETDMDTVKTEIDAVYPSIQI
jgi:hypothetical protein